MPNLENPPQVDLTEKSQFDVKRCRADANLASMSTGGAVFLAPPLSTIDNGPKLYH